MVGDPAGARERRDLVRHRLAADPDRPRRPRRRRRLVPATDRDPAPRPRRRRRRVTPVPDRPPRSPAAADPRDISGAWHHAPEMTDQAERYDRIAEGYARWWAPVLAPGRRSAHRSTGRPRRRRDRARHRRRDRDRPARARRPGALADAVGGRHRRVARDVRRGRCRGGPATDRRRPGTIPDRGGLRRRLPFEDGTFDLAMSSFVLQLVPNRHRALREIRRVLRPGGRLRLRDLAARTAGRSSRTGSSTSCSTTLGIESGDPDDGRATSPSVGPGVERAPPRRVPRRRRDRRARWSIGSRSRATSGS